MSGAAASAASDATDSGRVAPSRERLPRVDRPALPFGPLSMVLTLAGGLATGLATAAAMAVLSGFATPDSVAIEPVAAADIDAAAASLFGPGVVATVEAAKSCRSPLTFVTIQATGETSGLLRVRSGDYVTPNVRFNRVPVRVALPLPAPVAAGAGDITLISDTGGAAVFLRPAVVMPVGTQEKVIHVTWNPAMACRASQ